MQLHEVIEEHGIIVAARPEVGLIVAWDYTESTGVLSVMKDNNMNGDYELTEQYDLEGDNTPANAEEEAEDVLDDVLGEEGEENENE